jgi:hypothetical protein
MEVLITNWMWIGFVYILILFVNVYRSSYYKSTDNFDRVFWFMDIKHSSSVDDRLLKSVARHVHEANATLFRKATPVR